MPDEELIKQRLLELDAHYQQAVKQLDGLKQTLDTLQHYARHFADTGELNDGRYEMANETWMERANETINDLIRVDKEQFPTKNAVLSTIYLKLRDTYGVVIQQLRKDYRAKYDILRYPSALEAISDDKMIRNVFDSILVGLFPPSYFKDEALEAVDSMAALNSDTAKEKNAKDSESDAVVNAIKPLADQLEDTSPGHSETLNMICRNMDCNWKLLKARYRNKHGMSTDPSYIEIITNNKQVASKFKRTLKRITSNLDADAQQFGV